MAAASEQRIEPTRMGVLEKRPVPKGANVKGRPRGWMPRVSLKVWQTIRKVGMGQAMTLSETS